MNQYQNEQADRQRQQADREETGRLREQQGENRAESERRRQEQTAAALLQMKIDQLGNENKAERDALQKVKTILDGRQRQSPQAWANQFSNQNKNQDGILLDPEMCIDIEFIGKGRSICHARVKDIPQTPPRELIFPGSPK